MSFISLLIIFSLAIIVPLFFVLRSKRSNHSHENHVIPATSQQDSTPSFEDLFRYQLPEAFESILHDLANKHHSLSQKDMLNERVFTAKKLITVRVPELIYDYLKLDEHYAQTVIVDKAKQLTSQDLVLSQLQSIQHFIKKLDESGNADVVNNLLANRNYLQSIYQSNGLEAHTATQGMSYQTLLNETHQDDYIDYGYEYLHDFYPNQDTPIDAIVYELGRVVFLSDYAIKLTYQGFGKQVTLEYVDLILCESIPSLMDTLYELGKSASNRHQLLAARLFVQKLDDYASKIKQQLEKIIQAQTPEEQLTVISQVNDAAKALIDKDYFMLSVD